jgi:hypothetical protein
MVPGTLFDPDGLLINLQLLFDDAFVLRAIGLKETESIFQRILTGSEACLARNSIRSTYRRLQPPQPEQPKALLDFIIHSTYSRYSFENL